MAIEVSSVWTDPLLDLLFEDPGAGRCLVGPDRRVVRASSEWLRSIGLSAQEVVGADIAELFPEMRDVAEEVRAGHQGRGRQVSLRVRPGGQEASREAHLTALDMDGGTGFLLTTRAGAPRERLQEDHEEGHRPVPPAAAGGVATERSTGATGAARKASRSARSQFWPYLMVAGLVLLAALLREALLAKVGRLPPFIFFYPTVMLAAVLFGFYPGLLATALTVAAASWAFPSRARWTLEDSSDLVALLVFCAMGVFMSMVAGLYRRARQRAAVLVTELAVRETKDRLHLALKAAKAGAWEWDLRTNENTWSEELFEVYGLEPHSCKPSFEAWRDTIVPDDQAEAVRAVQEAARAGAGLNVEWRVKDRAGRERWLMSRGEALRDRDGAVVRYAGIVLDVTERKRAEEERRLSEERFEKAFQLSTSAMAVTRLHDGLFIEVNDRFLELMGRTREELIGKVTPAVGLWKDLEDREAYLRELRDHGVIQNAEYPFVRAGGEVFTGLVSGQRTEFKGEAVIINSVVDISGLRRALEELAQEREQLAVTLRSIGDAVIATDEAGKVTVLNSVAEALTGWAADEARGRPLGEVYHIVNEETREPVANPAERVLREGVLVGLANHTLLVARDGTLRPVADSGAPIREANGRLRGVVLVFRDQTEEREGERKLRESEARHRAIFEQAALGVAHIDTRTGRFLEVNSRFGEMLGYAREEVLARSWQDLTHPDELEVDRTGVRRMELSKTPYRREKRYLRKDGSVVWGSVTLSPVTISGEEVITQVAIVEDVTARRRAEEAMAAAERRQGFLFALADALRNVSDPVEIEGLAARLLGEHLRASRVHYAEVVEGGAWGVVHADYCQGLPSVRGRHRFDDYGPAVMKEFRAGRTLVVNDVHADERLSPAERTATEALSIAAYVMAPLMKSGAAAALLVVHQSVPRVWTRDDLTIIEATAERTFAAVERARAERALRLSEQRYRLLADHAHDVIWTLDLRAPRFTYVSPSIRSLRGLSVEEALAEPLQASLTEESLARVRQVMARIGTPDEQDPHTGVYDQPCKDGSIKHVEVTATLVRDVSGRPVEVLGVSRDATARVRAERALEDRERHLRAVLETALDGFWVVDDRGFLRDANAAYSTMTGYTRDELTRMHIRDLQALETPEETAVRIERIKRVGSERFETRHRCKDGRLIDVEAGVAYVGQSGSFVCFFKDITARKRADEAIRRNEERFRALIEKSSDMILVLDAEGRYRFWSRSAVEVLGWTAEEKVGQSALEMVHPDDRERIARVLEGVVATPGAVSRDLLRYRHKDGSWRQIEATARNLLQDPAVEGVVVNGRDVTSQRLLEERFQQAQKLETVGRLAGGVAHDFNNLLTVILSCSAELREDLVRGTTPRPEDVEEIHAAGERARDLTRQLLAFARKQVVAPVQLDLNDVVRGSQKMLGRLLGEDIDLRVNCQPGLWTLRADRGQVEQVLLNLAVNARDAMPRGGTLTIETRNVAMSSQAEARERDGLPGEWVRLVVRDSGAGMAPEVKAHLFEPFFTTKEQGRGTGLGLATVYGIVKQSGGHVHVESEVGRGSTFEVCFPREKREPTGSAPEARPTASGGTETILVVEDDVQVRAVIARALRGAGYRVLLATHGAEALALFASEKGPVHLVVTDVVMPGLGGRDLVEELGRRRDGLRVLYVSGYTREVISHHGVLDSGLEFLPKPFTAGALLAKVRAVLDRG